ncbi:hypothetical protein ALC62_04320 [Cyphomyrmex costatus]|uniref:Uncharacterized protein n=1 Tax=Cyphomyrmex costatus TaxID=456900 RepID=A0A195CWC9_9HYME|nr:hypothetical protein ALC62_04320 [Cyphomyrmex costatus]
MSISTPAWTSTSFFPPPDSSRLWPSVRKNGTLSGNPIKGVREFSAKPERSRTELRVVSYREADVRGRESPDSGIPYIVQGLRLLDRPRRLSMISFTSKWKRANKTSMMMYLTVQFLKRRIWFNPQHVRTIRMTAWKDAAGRQDDKLQRTKRWLNHCKLLGDIKMPRRKNRTKWEAPWCILRHGHANPPSIGTSYGVAKRLAADTFGSQ